jgi:two-component system CheB/CheR fusion protein
LVRQALLIPTPEVPPEEADDFRRILGLLHRGTGVDFAQYKQNTIKRRLLRRMMLDGFDKLGDYARHLAENPHEVQKVYEDILINVTGFFREPEAFEALQKVVFPAILRDRPAGDPIRVWIPGCATGEEAYSIAISLVEFLGDMAANMSIQIFATDVEDLVIDRARSGIYPEGVAADVSPERLRRFFVKLAPSYQVSKTIRDMCVFARQNLVKDPPFSRLDLISCRNVLIYFGPVLQQRVIPIFHFALKPNGFLILGKSEALGPFTDFFTLVDHKHKIYARRPMPLHAVLPTFAAGPGALPELTQRVQPPQKADRGADLLQEADRVVLARYAPAGIIIDEEMKILHFRGHTGPYLEPAPGEASLQLLKMAREGLGMDLRAAVHAAIQGNSPVRREGVQVRYNGSVRRINLEVLPLRSMAAAALPRYFLVLFEDVTPASPGPEAAQAPPKDKGLRGKRAALDDELKGLQNELAATKEYLQSVIEDKETSFEELKSTNEELLSANEELQSINQEMDTAKEELQSANEELSTLNEEVENRNQELAQANNDLTNLLTAVQIAIIILGPDLRIRRFNPMAQEMLFLIPSDQGRPLGDLKLGIDSADLEALTKEVLETLAVKELEVRARDGRWHSLRIRPYRTAANRIDGVVVTLVDIDTLKSSLEEVRSARNFAQSVVETCREALLVLDGTLRVVSANESFCRLFRVTPPETLNRLIYELGDRQWDIPDLRRLLEEILPENTVLQDYMVEHDFPKLGFRSMVLNARRLRQEEVGGELILLAMEDVTVRRQAEAALKESEQKLRALNAELMIAQEYERQAVSLALHEELAQDLSAMKLRLRQAEKKLPAAAGEAKEELVGILEAVSEMINGIRELSRGLRPDVLDLGLIPAIQQLLNQFSQYFQIDATIKVPDLDGLFFPQTQVMLYRILQEALVNVVKHAQATKVSVVIDKVDGKVSFMVADNGQGLRPERSIYKDMGKELGLKQEPAWLVGGVPFVMSENGKDFRLVEQSSPHYTPKKMGLVVMEERVRLLGGTLEITSRENAGARLAFTVPPEKQKV